MSFQDNIDSGGLLSESISYDYKNIVFDYLLSSAALTTTQAITLEHCEAVKHYAGLCNGFYTFIPLDLASHCSSIAQNLTAQNGVDCYCLTKTMEQGCKRLRAWSDGFGPFKRGAIIGGVFLFLLLLLIVVGIWQDLVSRTSSRKRRLIANVYQIEPQYVISFHLS